MKKIKLLMAACLAVVMIFSTAVPAFADTQGLEEVGGNRVSTIVTITKNLILDEKANVPELTFAFELSGNDEGLSTTNYPSFDGRSFLPSGPFEISFSAEDNESTATGIPAGSGQKYVQKTTVINFGTVDYDEPGVYRYILKETDSQVAGVTYSEEEYYIDVYVQWQPNNTGEGFTTDLVISGINVTKKSTTEKANAVFDNELATYDLTVDKKVTGNQGSHTQDFTFTVELENVPEDAQYFITYSSDRGSRPDKTIAANTDGKSSTTITLKHGESFVIENLPHGATYKITEAEETGYTVKSGTGSATLVKSNKVENTSGIVANTEVHFENDRSGTIPTGILVTVAPTAMIIVVAAAGVIMLNAKKKAKMAK